MIIDGCSHHQAGDVESVVKVPIKGSWGGHSVAMVSLWRVCFWLFRRVLVERKVCAQNDAKQHEKVSVYLGCTIVNPIGHSPVGNHEQFCCAFIDELVILRQICRTLFPFLHQSEACA